jgi:RNA polymerase sigma-70 factor (ECF subfamily)
MRLFGKRYSQQTDEQLMRLLVEGQEAAFDELYQRYSRRLLYYFYRMLGQDEDTAQDFLQDLFIKIVEKPQLFNPSQQFSTWVFAVAHNLCKNEYRKQAVRKVLVPGLDVDQLAEESIPAEVLFDNQLFQQWLQAGLDVLDDDQRTTFLLFYQEHFSIREISEVLGCAEGTVKSRLFYVKRKLANQLKVFTPYNR